MFLGKGELLLLEVMMLPPILPCSGTCPPPQLGTEATPSAPKPRGRVRLAPPCAAGCGCAIHKKVTLNYEKKPKFKVNVRQLCNLYKQANKLLDNLLLELYRGKYLSFVQQPVHSCFEVNCMIAGAVQRNHQV